MWLVWSWSGVGAAPSPLHRYSHLLASSRALSSGMFHEHGKRALKKVFNCFTRGGGSFEESHAAQMRCKVLLEGGLPGPLILPETSLAEGADKGGGAWGQETRKLPQASAPCCKLSAISAGKGQPTYCTPPLGACLCTCSKVSPFRNHAPPA